MSFFMPIRLTAVLLGLFLLAPATVSAEAAYSWGANFDGQLGNGSTTDSLSPVPVDSSGPFGGRTVSAIAAGGSHSLP